jgi:uncharacterized RDD family membrane protein YckC
LVKLRDMMIPLDAPPARFRHRLLAWIYDLCLVIGLLFATGFVALAINGGEAIPAGTGWYRLLLVFVVTSFYVGFWVKGGQTLGMKAWRLVLVDDQHRTLGLGHAIRRCLAAIPTWLPAAAGFLWMLVDAHQLTWQDRLSGSRVVQLSAPAKGQRQ